MPKIEIKELDLTTPGSVIETTDVVFVPGFVDFTQETLNLEVENEDGTKETKYIGIATNDPQLFTSVNAFTAACGDNAPVFIVDQTYADTGVNFASESHANDTDVMFKAGTADPGYVMAKELLAAGLPVLFQRVNDNSDTNEITYKYEPVSDSVAAGLVGTRANADSKYFYKCADNTYKAYNAKLYPDFNATAYPQNVEDTKVFKMRTFTRSEVDTNYPTQAEGEAISHSAYIDDNGNITTQSNSGKNVPFYNLLYVSMDKGSTYTQFATDTNNLIPKESIPADAEFAMLVAVNEEPDDWSTNYSDYYVESTATRARTTTVTYNKISAYASEQEYKIYTTGDIFAQVESPKQMCTVKKMYAALANIFSTENAFGILDKGNYDVKYLTSGGYPVFETEGLTTAMLQFAKERGDCVALIDHTDYRERTLDTNNANSLYKKVVAEKSLSLSKGEFGTMFTPWATYDRTTTDTILIPDPDPAAKGDEMITEDVTEPTFRAPGSFAYLMALADSIKTNASWLAIAGAARGGLKNCHEMTTNIPNGIADAMQPRNDISINAITNIKPYGYTIWGNRTLKNNAKEKNLVATSFLNIRNLISDVKKTCYSTARSLTFEQDTDILWINFKSKISKLLDQMKSGYGISGYKIVRDTSHARAADKGTICAQVILYPTYAVEDFYITIVLKDDEVTVE